MPELLKKGGINLDIELLIKIVTRVVLELADTGIVDLAEKENAAEAAEKKRHAFCGQKVICMEDLKGIESGILETCKNTVITPLARDYIKEKGIEMVEV